MSRLATESSRLWPLWACLLLFGCRSPGHKAYLELLNQEKRALEDELYDLTYDYEILLDKVERLEQGQVHEHAPGPIHSPFIEDISPPQRELPSPRRAEPRPNRETPSPEPAPADSTPSDSAADAPGDSSTAPPLTPPSLTPPSLTPPSLTPPADGAEPPPAGRTTRTDVEGVPGGVDGVATIRINPLRTGGEDFDGHPGDDGISVLVEPLSRLGAFVPQPADISVVVADPISRTKVARWDLTAEQVAQYLVPGGPDHGLRLKLPWPGVGPEQDRLHLFVRYTTPDGRRLEADREFFVSRNAGMAQRWTPRGEPRVVREPAATPSGTPPRQAARSPEWRPYR